MTKFYRSSSAPEWRNWGGGGGGKGGVINFWVTQKLCFLEFESKDKKRSSPQNLQKIDPCHGFWIDGQYFGSLRPRTVGQRLRNCYYVWGTILAWGARFSFGWTQAVIWGGHGPGMLSPWHRAITAYLGIFFEVSDPKLWSGDRSTKNYCLTLLSIPILLSNFIFLHITFVSF